MARAIGFCVLLSILLGVVGCSPAYRVEREEGAARVYKNDKLIAELTEVWEKTYLTAEGQAPVPPGYKESDPVGRDLARDHALLEARTNMLSQLEEVYLTETISVLNGAVKSHRTSEIKGIISGAEIIDERWDEDKKAYIVGIQLPQVKLVKYVKEWIDNGIVDPVELDKYVIRSAKAP